MGTGKHICDFLLMITATLAQRYGGLKAENLTVVRSLTFPTKIILHSFFETWCSAYINTVYRSLQGHRTVSLQQHVFLYYQTTQLTACTFRIDRSLERNCTVSLCQHGFLVVGLHYSHRNQASIVCNSSRLLLYFLWYNVQKFRTLHHSVSPTFLRCSTDPVRMFYRSMHFSAKRGLAIARTSSICLSVRLSVRL